MLPSGGHFPPIRAVLIIGEVMVNQGMLEDFYYPDCTQALQEEISNIVFITYGIKPKFIFSILTKYVLA